MPFHVFIFFFVRSNLPELVARLRRKYEGASAPAAAPAATAAPPASPFATPTKPAGGGLFGATSSAAGPSPFGAGAGFGAPKPSPFGGGGPSASGFGQVGDRRDRRGGNRRLLAWRGGGCGYSVHMSVPIDNFHVAVVAWFLFLCATYRAESIFVNHFVCSFDSSSTICTECMCVSNEFLLA